MSRSPEPPPPAERRPVATRQACWAGRVARTLARRGVSPNAISIAGLASGVLAGAAFVLTARWPEQARLGWITGACLVQLRLAANMFDGMVAVETRSASPLGELYNEIPDRISDACALIGLGCAAGGDVVLGFVAACLALFVAYLRAMGKVAGAHQEFCGPMAKPQRMFLVTVTALYAGLSPASWPLHPAGAAPRSVVDWVLALIIAGCVITSIRRLKRIAAALGRAPASR